MPSYIISNCLLGTPISFIVTASTLSIGETVSVNKDEVNYCGMVMSEDDLIPDSVLLDEGFRSCCDCLTASTGGNYTSFEFNECNSVNTIYIDIITFCNEYGNVPSVDSVWKLFNLDTNENICATFKGPSSEIGVTFWIPDEGPFEECELCPTGFITKTANTIYEACVVCCPCESGETITSVAVPHPTFTDLYGNPVIQGNAVLIGGNGLNS